MSKAVLQSLAADPLQWIDFGRQLRSVDSEEHAGRQRRTACALVKRLYGRNPVPGVILGDEVGMGKTYEAMAVVAGLLRHKPTARVVILAHSGPMVRTWHDRWESFCTHAVDPAIKLPKGDILDEATEVGHGAIEFASFDKLKRVPKADLAAALGQCLNGRYLRTGNRRKLVKALLGTSMAGTNFEFSMPKRARDAFWKSHYDKDKREWRKVGRAKDALRELVHQGRRRRSKIDLVVVDEAHKMDSKQRNLFLRETLRKRCRKVLYVTATPFSLSVEQLIDRIHDMHVVTGTTGTGLINLETELRGFRAAVLDPNVPMPDEKKRKLERKLRSYLVRSVWPEKMANGLPRRQNLPLRPDMKVSDRRQAYAMLGLETSFARLAKDKARTYVATHRETLSSSYAALRAAAKASAENGSKFARHLHPLCDLLPKSGELPKFDAVCSELVRQALRGEKVVVFCSRIATINALRRALNKTFKSHLESARLRWDRVRSRVKRAAISGRGKFSSQDMARLRLATYHFGAIEGGKEFNALRRLGGLLKSSGEPGDSEKSRRHLWEQSWGVRRRVDWVGVLSGSEGGGTHKRSPDAIRFAFNLPGPPYILLCTEIAREGIDLHLWCRRVVQYDLEWNPGLMEQRIGRVDRIGSLASRVSKPLEIYWPWMPGTYEQFMMGKISGRMAMIRVLLGAGEWLADSPEDQKSVSIDDYRMSFKPEAHDESSSVMR